MRPAEAVATWDDLYEHACGLLASRREARWIVEEVSGERLGAAVGNPPEKARVRLEEMLARRVAGEPLQYVLGSWAFRGLDLMVDGRVLIPRPETEEVAGWAVAEVDRLRFARGRGQSTTVVDLGTGSGAIGLSMAAERTGVEVWATDVSPAAVDVARANLAGLGGFAATRVRIAQGDWWAALPADLWGTVDVVVSNPPYISSAEMDEVPPEVSGWEPRLALDAGPRGTEALELIVATAPGWLRVGGTLVVEMAPHQAVAMADAARRAGFAEVLVRADLAGRDRALVARGAPGATRRPAPPERP